MMTGKGEPHVRHVRTRQSGQTALAIPWFFPETLPAVPARNHRRLGHPANPALSSWLASWYHILSGLLVVILSLLLAADSLTKRGFHYFFPYLWGDTEQLKKDIQASLRFKMVPPRPKGLATAVQGLGLGALLLVVLSGLIWFILWRNGSSFAGLALETHKNVTLLIELYLIGHGCMALLHFFVWQRNKARQE